MKRIIRLSGKQLVAEKRFRTELNQHDEGKKHRRRNKQNDKGGEKEKDSCVLDNSKEILKQSKSRSKAAFTRARHTLLQLLDEIYQAVNKCVKQVSDQMNV